MIGRLVVSSNVARTHDHRENVTGILRDDPLSPKGVVSPDHAGI